MGRSGYPPEFRAEAVALYRSSGRSMREIAQDLGISNESLGRWIHQADIDEDAGRGSPPRSGGRSGSSAAG
jgi:transposase